MKLADHRHYDAFGFGVMCIAMFAFGTMFGYFVLAGR